MKHMILLALACTLLTSHAWADDPVNADKNGLAIKGYDPVAYFEEGGGEPAKGDKDITAEHEGATYRFVSESNRELFLADTEKFMPTYGGWCAYAMADGEKVKVDPKRFEIYDGKLYLFYRDWFNDTLKPWQEKRDELKPKADQHWQEIAEKS